MRKIKRNKLAVSAFALAASASLLFAGNVFATQPADVGQVESTSEYVAYTDTTSSKIDYSFNGVRAIDDGGLIGDLRYFVDGHTEKAKNVTGLKPYNSVTGKKFAYIKDGKGTSYDGIAEYEGVQYYVKGGFVDTTTLAVSNTIVKQGNKEYLVNKGVVDTSFTGLVQLDTENTGVGTAGVTAVVLNKDMTSANFVSGAGYINKVVYVEKGVVSTTYEGFAELKGIQYYVVDGTLADKTTTASTTVKFENSVRKLGDSWVILKAETPTGKDFLVAGNTMKPGKSGVYGAKSEFGLNPYTKNAYIVKNGVVDFSCNELHKVDPAESTTGAVTAAYDAFFKTTSAGATAFDNKLLKVTNGKLDFKYSDFCTYKYVEDTTNLKKEITFFLVDGQLAPAATAPEFDGCVRPLNGDWVYVEEATINEATGAAPLVHKGAALYVKNAAGKKYTGLAINPYTKDIYYVKDNKVDFTYGDVYVVQAGDALVTVAGLTPSDKVKFTRGKYRDNFTGFATYNFVINGVATNDTLYFLDGEVADYTLLGVDYVARPANDGTVWYAVAADTGKLNYNYKGIVYNPYTLVGYYAENGVVNFSYNGTFTDGHITYTNVNGKVNHITVK